MLPGYPAGVAATSPPYPTRNWSRKVRDTRSSSSGAERARYFLAPGKRGWSQRPLNSPQRSRQQAAEDLLWIIERCANCADMIGRSTYKALMAIFNQQCGVREGKVVEKADTGAAQGATTIWHPESWVGPFGFAPCPFLLVPDQRAKLDVCHRGPIWAGLQSPNGMAERSFRIKT